MLPVLQQWELQVLPLLEVSSPNTYLFRCFSPPPQQEEGMTETKQREDSCLYEIFRRNQNFLYNYWSRISSLRWQCIWPNTSLEEQSIISSSYVSPMWTDTLVDKLMLADNESYHIERCTKLETVFGSACTQNLHLHHVNPTDVNHQLATIGINLVKAKSGMSASKFSIILNIIATL